MTTHYLRNIGSYFHPGVYLQRAANVFSNEPSADAVFAQHCLPLRPPEGVASRNPLTNGQTKLVKILLVTNVFSDRIFSCSELIYARQPHIKVY